MSEQRQIQSGETFINEATGQKVTRTGTQITYFDASGNQTSTIDISRPENEAAGFLSSQFIPQGSLAEGPAITQTEIREQQYFRPDLTADQARQEASTFRTMSYEDRLSSFNRYNETRPRQQSATLINPATGKKEVVESGSARAAELFSQGWTLFGSGTSDRYTANRTAESVSSDAVIGPDGQPMINTRQKSLDPEGVQRNISLDMVQFKEGLDEQQQQGILDLLNSGRQFNETDAQNYAFAIGDDNWQQYVGKTGNQIYDTALQGGAEEQLPSDLTITEEDLLGDMGDTSEVGTELLGEAFGNPTVYGDIQALLEQSEDYRQKLLATLTPTDVEMQLQSQVDELAETARNLILSAEMGIEEIMDQPIAMPFLIGQAKNVEDRANLKLKALAAQQQTLLDNLGMQQEARQAQTATYEALLAFNKEDIDLTFKIQDRIQANEDRIFERTMAMQSGAKETLTTILDSFQGMYFDKLTADQQSQLANLASQAGIPIDLIQAGMDNVAGQMAFQAKLDAMKEQMGYTQEGFKYEMDLRKEFNGRQEVKDYNEINTRFVQMIGAYNALADSDGDLTPAKEAIQLLFQKMLDPGSVVREGEFARSAAGQSLIDRAEGFYQQLKEGGYAVTNENLRQMVDVAMAMRNGAEQTYNQVRGEYINIGDAMGLNTERIVGTGGAGFEGTQNSPNGYIDEGGNQIMLGTLTKSYPDLGTLLEENPSYWFMANDLAQEVPGITDQEILSIIEQASTSSFNSDLGMSVNGSALTSSVQQTYPEGSYGGQCTTFLHNLVEFPPIGDGKLEKYANVDRIGMRAGSWYPRIGDVIVTNENPTYGHTAMVTNILPDGSLVLTESNYKRSEIVSHDRTIAWNDPRIYGAIRPSSFKV